MGENTIWNDIKEKAKDLSWKFAVAGYIITFIMCFLGLMYKKNPSGVYKKIDDVAKGITGSLYLISILCSGACGKMSIVKRTIAVLLITLLMQIIAKLSQILIVVAIIAGILIMSMEPWLFFLLFL